MSSSPPDRPPSAPPGMFAAFWKALRLGQARSIRTALLLLVLVAVVPLVLLQVVIYWEWFSTRQEDELQSNREVARGVAAAFLAFVRDVGRQNGALATAVDPHDSDFLRHAGRVLASRLQDYEAISAWYMLDLQGKVAASARPELRGRTSPAAQDALKEVVAGKELVITDLEPRGVRGERVFAIARQWQDEKGQRLGAVVAEVDASKLGVVALTIERVEQGRYTLFDRNGRWVYSYPTNIRIPPEAWRAGDPLLDEALRERHDTQGVSILPFDDRPRFASRIYIPELGWAVGASRPVEVAMAEEYKNLRVVTGLNLLIIAVSGVGAALVGRRIVVRLSRLREHAQTLGEGHLDHRVAIVGVRELAELGEHFNQMAQRLQERSLEVEKAMADLGRSNKELEQFAYVASHDLQEPLRVIAGYLQLIERRYRERLDADGEQFINYVVEAVYRMQQLIADLLEYSRVGTRGRPPAPADMEAILAQATQALQKSIDESGAMVTHDPLPTVTGDWMQLAQLLQNLIANAIKFHGHERPEIHVSAAAEDSQWRFSVRDNGIGIEPQYWAQIFLIFQRLHTRQKYKGTGIGLAICKRIVERHGGRIWLDSEPGRGTTFYFTLPFTPASDGAS